jgi:hypothetical protein
VIGSRYNPNTYMDFIEPNAKLLDPRDYTNDEKVEMVEE